MLGASTEARRSAVDKPKIHEARFEWLHDGRNIAGYRSSVHDLKNCFAPPDGSVILNLEIGGPELKLT